MTLSAISQYLYALLMSLVRLTVSARSTIDSIDPFLLLIAALFVGAVAPWVVVGGAMGVLAATLIVTKEV